MKGLNFNPGLQSSCLILLVWMLLKLQSTGEFPLSLTFYS